MAHRPVNTPTPADDDRHD